MRITRLLPQNFRKALNTLSETQDTQQASVDAIEAQTLGSFTVANLPAAGTAGRTAFATDGRKDGEGVGAGTGVLVYDDGTDWKTVDTSATVLA